MQSGGGGDLHASRLMLVTAQPCGGWKNSTAINTFQLLLWEDGRGRKKKNRKRVVFLNHLDSQQRCHLSRWQEVVTSR